MNPCKKCGSNKITVSIEPNDANGAASQYMSAVCECGRRGGASWYFKNCGMDEMNDEQIAVMNWNDENPVAEPNHQGHRPATENIV